MKEKPIPFDGRMVRAILEGRKTQTRWVVIPTQTKPRVAPLTMESWLIDGEQEVDDDGLPCWAGYHPEYPGEAKWFSCPFGGVGDRLWVREAWNAVNTRGFFWDEMKPSERPGQCWATVLYRALEEQNKDRYTGRYVRSASMPRDFSRITLEITVVRAERLQDISEADICAELGCPVVWPDSGPEPYTRDLRTVFAAAWNARNAKRGPAFTWSSNPWVWTIGFKRVLS